MCPPSNRASRRETVSSDNVAKRLEKIRHNQNDKKPEKSSGDSRRTRKISVISTMTASNSYTMTSITLSKEPWDD